MLAELVVRGGGRTITVPAGAMTWTAVRASGPGGQNVNKVSSKVELRVAVFKLGLDAGSWTRLRTLAGSKMSDAGELLVVSQVTRDQSRNLEDARAKVAALIAQALVAPRPRRPTKPSRGAKQRRLTAKSQRGERKKERGTRPGRDD